MAKGGSRIKTTCTEDQEVLVKLTNRGRASRHCALGPAVWIGGQSLVTKQRENGPAGHRRVVARGGFLSPKVQQCSSRSGEDARWCVAVLMAVEAPCRTLRRRQHVGENAPPCRLPTRSRRHLVGCGQLDPSPSLRYRRQGRAG